MATDPPNVKSLNMINVIESICCNIKSSGMSRLHVNFLAKIFTRLEYLTSREKTKNIFIKTSYFQYFYKITYCLLFSIWSL